MVDVISGLIQPDAFDINRNLYRKDMPPLDSEPADPLRTINRLLDENHANYLNFGLLSGAIIFILHPLSSVLSARYLKPLTD